MNDKSIISKSFLLVDAVVRSTALFAISILLLVCIVVLAFNWNYSTGQQVASAKNKIELTIWETYKFQEHELFLQQLERFKEWYRQKTGKHVVFKAHRVPYDDLETNVRLAALGGKTPDIARVDVFKVLEFAYHRVLVPLDTLKNFGAESIAAKREQYIPGAFDTNVVEIQGQQHLYGLPEQVTCLALFWNRQMFQDKAKELKSQGLDPKSAPKTWKELIKYGKVLTTSDKNGDPAKSRYGFAMTNKLWFTLPFFGCYGVSYLQTDNQGNQICVLGDKRSTAALRLKVNLYRKYKIEAGAWQQGGTAPDIGFLNKKYAMILMGPWFIQEFRKAGIDLGIALIPRITKKSAIHVGLLDKDANDEEYRRKVLPATNIGGSNMVIFKTCRHPEVAYELINYLASKKAQLLWCRTLNQIPVNVEAAKALSEDPHTDPDIRIFMKQALYATAPPLLPRYGYVENDIVNPEMELALKGRKTAKQALQDAARKINQQILEVLNRANQ